MMPSMSMASESTPVSGQAQVLVGQHLVAIYCRLFSAAQAFEMLNLVVQTYITCTLQVM